MSKAKTAVTMSGAAAIACCVAFTPTWEGTDLVAKRDMIGTGHPVTYCNGLTDEFGKVKVGQRFTPDQCRRLLEEALPKYWDKIAPYIERPLPDKTAGALLDAAWNTGPAAVVRSPMLAHMNAGNVRAGCDAFAGWYVRSDGKVRVGLQARRAGELHGDKRKSERALCLEGLREGVASGNPFSSASALIVEHEPERQAPSVAVEVMPERAPAPPAVQPAPKPAPKKRPLFCWIFKC